jgi:Domain of unknown function (DUF4835)
MHSNSIMRHSTLFFAAIITLCCTTLLQAQGELNATVRINTPQLQRTERRVFDQLEIALRDWLNNTKWTNDAFLPEERVKCTFIMTVRSEGENNTFTANMAINATRPVFGSGYETSLLSTQDDDFSFSYEQNQPIEFITDNAENTNLTAVFAFYAYVILGLDYDSYSLYGGDQYIQQAQQLVQLIQNSQSNRSAGWRPSSGDKNRSRFWLAENLTSPRIRPFRAGLYGYHRQGLDMFSSNQENARTNVIAALEEIEKAGIAYLNSMIIQLFVQAKRDEIIEMMKRGTVPQRQRVFQIMTRIDPASTQRYREMGV